MRKLIGILVVIVASAALGAEDYPARTVHVVVPFAPGGFGALIKTDMDKWGEIGRRLGVQLD